MVKTEYSSVTGEDINKPTQEEIRLLRRLSILKLLQDKPMRTKEIAELCDVDERTIRSDVDALRVGLNFLGVKVKIDSKHKGSQEHYYISNVHPIFLALNSTVVLALLRLLEEASKGQFSGSVYEHIFNMVYSQLTEYAKELIQDKLEKKYDSTEIQNLLEEEAVNESEHHAIAYLFKSGKPVTVSFTNELAIIREVQITDIRGNELCLRAMDGTEYLAEYSDVVINWHKIDYK